MELLTNSRQQCFKVCRKQHWFQFENRIRREVDGKALRQGTAYHAALDAMASGGIDPAMVAVAKSYSDLPETLMDEDVIMERETVAEMVNGYAWRWQEAPLDYVAKELSFELPLINPGTRRPSTLFSLAGKIDGIVKLTDDRLAVIEHKLLSDDLSSDTELWRRLRIDQQISMYVLAARRLGYAVDTALYDVGRKPTIKPNDVAVLDDLGAKIVLDTSGYRVKTERGLWRQTGDKEKGFTLQTRAMTPDEWAEKLREDIGKRPEFYFSRIEVPRLDQDIEEFSHELWDLQKTIREAQKTGRWYRTATKHTCQWCSVFDLCTSGFDPSGPLPEGYVRLTDMHPELSKEIACHQ